MQHLYAKTLPFKNIQYVQPLTGGCHNMLKMDITFKVISNVYAKNFS